MRVNAAMWFGLFFCAPALSIAEPIHLAATPALSPDGKTLVFEWDGDLWKASSAGGRARPLTLHPARDVFVGFSPEGTRIAFTSLRSDTWQAYVMPAEGGPARQVTFNTEGCTVLGWFPDGNAILILAARDQAGPYPTRLFRVEVEDPYTETLLFDAYASGGTVSPDGRQVLFTQHGIDLYRKGYRGSKASRIWLADLESGTFTEAASHEMGCRSPMWMPDGKGFYYLSGRTGVFNLWERQLATGHEKQRTFFTEDSIILPTISADGSTIVFRNRFDFYRFRPAADADPVTIPLQHSEDRDRRRTVRRSYNTVWNDNDWGTLDFSKDGRWILMTIGGDVWIMDRDVRDPKPLTQGGLYHDTEAVFSGDGQAVFFLRDSGEAVNLWKAELADPGRPWTENSQFVLSPLTADSYNRYNLSVSPGGDTLVYVKGRGTLCTAHLDGGNERELLSRPYDVYYDWAPDGKWLACTLKDSDENSDVWIVSTGGTHEPYNLSRGPNWDGYATWSPDGRAIAFISRTYERELLIRYAWLHEDDEARMQRAEQSQIYSDMPISDGMDAVAVSIEFEGLAERVRTIDLPESVPNCIFWSFDSRSLAFCGTHKERAGTFRLTFPENLTPTLLQEKTGLWPRWVRNGSQIQWLVDGVPHASLQAYPFMAYQEIEWPDYQRLGFRQAWRFLRDGFYDAEMNGRDWDALLEKYEDLAADAPDADRFAKTVSMLVGELNASHLGFDPAEDSDAWRTGNWMHQTAHLGLRFDDAYEGPGLKVASVIPDGPTAHLPSRVEPGEVVLRIEGARLQPGVNLARLLTGHWPRTIRLDVRGPGGTERPVDVPHTSYEALRGLLQSQDLEQNRDIVRERGHGRLGYLHVGAMDWEDLQRFERDMYAQGYDKEGLVLDFRDNNGGFVVDHLLMILCHPRHAVTRPRGGTDSYPVDYLHYATCNKPIVVLCNQDTTSNGEIFCHAIKTLGRGKIVGVPTRGSVISMPSRPLLTLGTLYVPDRGWYVASDGRNMEMNGVQPDRTVWPLPGEMPAGFDRQLEAAVDMLLEDLGDAAQR